MSEQRIHIIKASLSHYSNRLTKLSQLGDIPEIIKLELIHEYEKVKDALDNVETYLNTKALEQFNETPDYSEYICSALTCYLYDLENSLSEISEKLTNVMKFEPVKQEIELAKKAITDFRCDMSLR